MVKIINKITMKIKSSFSRSFKITKSTLKNGTHYFKVHFKNLGGWFFFWTYIPEFATLEDAINYVDEKIAKDNASYKHPVVKTETIDF